MPNIGWRIIILVTIKNNLGISTISFIDNIYIWYGIVGNAGRLSGTGVWAVRIRYLIAWTPVSDGSNTGLCQSAVVTPGTAWPGHSSVQVMFRILLICFSLHLFHLFAYRPVHRGFRWNLYECLLHLYIRRAASIDATNIHKGFTGNPVEQGDTQKGERGAGWNR